MSALSTHHKRTKRSDKKKQKWRTQASDKKLRKAEIVTYSSRDRSPKTRAKARRNRSKAKTWLLKDRGNARRSHARSRGKMRKTRRQNQSRNSTSKVFPSHMCNSPKMMHSCASLESSFIFPRIHMCICITLRGKTEFIRGAKSANTKH